MQCAGNARGIDGTTCTNKAWFYNLLAWFSSSPSPSLRSTRENTLPERLQWAPTIITHNNSRNHITPHQVCRPILHVSDQFLRTMPMDAYMDLGGSCMAIWHMSQLLKCGRAFAYFICSIQVVPRPLSRLMPNNPTKDNQATLLKATSKATNLKEATHKEATNLNLNLVLNQSMCTFLSMLIGQLEVEALNAYLANRSSKEEGQLRVDLWPA